MKNKTILSDKISEALTVKQSEDIEDDYIFKTKPKTLTRQDLSSESEDETTISDFRKRNVALLSDLSSKYEGKVVPRDEGSSGSSDVESESHDEANMKPVSDSEDFLSNDDKGNDLEKSSEDEDSANSESESFADDEEGYSLSKLESPPEVPFEHIKKVDISEEAKKGFSIRNQLLIWENLLEMRIHLQRCLLTANQLPLPETFQELKSQEGSTLDAASASTKASVVSVLENLLELQEALLKKHPETKDILQDSKTANIQNSESKTEEHEGDNEEIPSDDEIPSDTESEEESQGDRQPPKESSKNTPSAPKRRKLSDYPRELEKRHKSLLPFRDATIQKWNQKTNVASANSQKGTTANTVLSQINFILGDRDKLVKRTQLKRSEYDIIGYKKDDSKIESDADDTLNQGLVPSRKDDDEYIPEIFDDSDFYHQLLRELIECKSADISDPVQLSRQWITLQQMRSKMKRKVDTKATKGRRIKYVVHNKLINFLAPEANANWSDAMKDELYSSLFGKGFENNTQQVYKGFTLMK